MRYTVHTPRTFHHRITKYLGVLVGAALIAALGLPSAAQAQAPAAPEVVTDPNPAPDTGVITGLNVMFGPALGGTNDQEGWRVEYAEPGEDAMMMILAVSETELPSARDADDPRIHHGVWRFRVSYWNKAAMDEADVAEADKGKVVGMPSAWTSYHHGPPATAPTGLTAYEAGPDARRLVWDEMDALTYEFRYTADATDPMEWTMWAMAVSGDTVDELEMGTEYMFELRGLGATRAGVGDLHGPSATITEMMPVPTPTLPEIALLLLAMLLLGGGAYLLRGRQSSGLTHA